MLTDTHGLADEIHKDMALSVARAIFRARERWSTGLLV